MNDKIYKYDLPAPNTTGYIQLPVNAQILHVNDGHLWAKFNVMYESNLDQRKFIVIGTGYAIDLTSTTYIGTYMDGPFVWHVFEEK